MRRPRRSKAPASEDQAGVLGTGLACEWIRYSPSARLSYCRSGEGGMWVVPRIPSTTNATSSK